MSVAVVRRSECDPKNSGPDNAGNSLTDQPAYCRVVIGRSRPRRKPKRNSPGFVLAPDITVDRLTGLLRHLEPDGLAPFVWRCLTGSTLAPFPHPPGHRRRSPAPGSHRTWRADFPHQRSSAVASQHCKRRQLPVGEAQFRCQQRCPFFDSIEGVLGEVAAGPAAAAQHPAPVTLHDPIYLDETPGRGLVGHIKAETLQHGPEQAEVNGKPRPHFDPEPDG
jgi:hypothetical protein